MCKYMPVQVSWKGFERFADGKRLLFMHASYCSHCRAMLGEWQKVKAHYAAGGGVVAEEYEASANPDIMTQEGVEGFPTIILHKGATKLTYNGERTAEAMIAWADAA